MSFQAPLTGLKRHGNACITGSRRPKRACVDRSRSYADFFQDEEFELETDACDRGYAPTLCEASERMERARIRAEQDAALAESLALDQARAYSAPTPETAQPSAAELALQRSLDAFDAEARSRHATTCPPASGGVLVRARTPTGSLERRFGYDAMVWQVVDWLVSEQCYAGRDERALRLFDRPVHASERLCTAVGDGRQGVTVWVV